MFMRFIKWGTMSLAAAGVASGVIFGRDLGSYFSSSSRSDRSAPARAAASG